MSSGVGLQQFFQSNDTVTRSIHNIREACKLLGIGPDHAQSLIDPQDMHIYRLYPNIGGMPVTVWGCTAFHNRSRGTYKGGIRISDDVSVGETMELARLMTLKTALTELELGGAKTGILFDMKAVYKQFGKTGYDRAFESSVKRAIMREYAHHYRGMLERKRYVPAPDMGTGPQEMVVIYDETKNPSSVTGKPEGIPGWLPGRAEATGYGVFFVLKKCADRRKQDLAGLRVTVQGFGNVGSHAALFLAKAGAKIIAVADKDGAVGDAGGLDVEQLAQYVKSNGSVAGFGAKALTMDEFFTTKSDYFIPAAINDSLTEEVAQILDTGCVIEGANFPTTLAGLNTLTARGIEVIPDIIANAGGVIASCEEYTHPASTCKMTKEQVFATIGKAIGRNLDLAWNTAEERGVTLDLACTLVAVERVYLTMKNHGWC